MHSKDRTELNEQGESCGRDVAGLMVGMENKVHTGNVFVLVTLTDHVGEVCTHVEFRIDSDLLVTLVLQVINECSNDGDTGNDVAGILIHAFPSYHFVELA